MLEKNPLSSVERVSSGLEAWSRRWTKALSSRFMHSKWGGTNTHTRTATRIQHPIIISLLFRIAVCDDEPLSCRWWWKQKQTCCNLSSFSVNGCSGKMGEERWWWWWWWKCCFGFCFGLVGKSYHAFHAGENDQPALSFTLRGSHSRSSPEREETKCCFHSHC